VYATGATGALLEAERANVHSVREEQHCLLVNEKKIVEGQSIVQQEKLASASANSAGQPLQRLGAPHAALGMCAFLREGFRMRVTVCSSVCVCGCGSATLLFSVSVCVSSSGQALFLGSLLFLLPST
jgi:hypothetical protein